MENIKIQYLNDEIKRLEYIDGKSDWIDLRADLNLMNLNHLSNNYLATINGYYWNNYLNYYYY